MFQEENTRNTSNRALFVQFFPFATEVVIVGESDTPAAAEDIDVLAVPPPAGNIPAVAVLDTMMAAVRDTIPSAAHDTMLAAEQGTMLAAVQDTTLVAAQDTMLAAAQDTMLAAAQDNQ